MEFRILGPLEVLSDGRTLDLGGQKLRALVALLVLEANRVVSRDRLIDALWEEAPPETAVKALQVYISQLRKQLGKDRVQTKAPGYVLRVEPDELDLARFRRLQEEGELRQALSLWRGPPLADLGDQRFAQAEIAHLEELRAVCLEERIAQDLSRGRHAELVGELEALVKEHPLRERLRGQLMLCLYRSGRQAEALEVYQAARNALVEELGIEPGRDLRELHQAILEQDPELDLAVAAEPARSAFVGREPELAELVGGLDEAFAGAGRLFLLVGEPGIGKSRLAEEVIAHARARGARVLVGRCWEAGGAPAYWPWVQSLRTYVRESDTAALRSQLGAGAGDLAQIVPELRQHFPDPPEPLSLDPEGARFRLFDATAEFLRNASASRPILLLLDDLHAADEPSLLLLRFLSRELGSTRMLVLGT
jgi:DNA-binding SARP family transcriptional activator